jgi:prepilin-type processing-associated H-X9-DG protein
LKQIGLGLMQYAQDFDGWTPSSSFMGQSWPSMIFPYIKGEQLFACPSGELDKVRRAILGPASTRTYCGLTTDGDGSSTASRKIVHGPISYTMNAIKSGPFPFLPAGYGWTTDGFKGTVAAPGPNGPKTGFVNPSDTDTTFGVVEPAIEDAVGTIRVFDGWGGVNGAAACDVGSSLRAIGSEDRTDQYLTDKPSKTAARHFDGFNALYGDGHVKWRKWGTTTADEWSIQSDNPDGTRK